MDSPVSKRQIINKHGFVCPVPIEDWHPDAVCFTANNIVYAQWSARPTFRPYGGWAGYYLDHSRPGHNGLGMRVPYTKVDHEALVVLDTTHEVRIPFEDIKNHIWWRYMLDSRYQEVLNRD